MNQDRQLQDLPIEIHRFIFSFLPFNDMNRMACVSNYWRKLNEYMLFTKTHYIRLEYEMLRMERAQDKLNREISIMRCRTEPYCGPGCVNARCGDEFAGFVLCGSITMLLSIIICGFVLIFYFLRLDIAMIVCIAALVSLRIFGICTIDIICSIVKKLNERFQYLPKRERMCVKQLIKQRNVFSKKLENFHQRNIEV